MPTDDLSADSASSPSWSGESTLADELDRGFEPAEGTVVGRYTVLRTVGRGAWGVVVAAFDPHLDRKVALKFLHGTAASDDEHDRLRREAQALARLTHPNVIRVHDAGTFEGRVFMATELVDGDDLSTWRSQREPRWQTVLDVMLAAGEGLAAAHAAGLVHRDFKPRNVLMGSDGRPRVTDFGQARGYDERPPMGPPLADDGDLLDEASVDGSITRTGTLAGTPAYMAPEQLAGSPADPRADQWSFCVSLYEMLWGLRPFRGSTLAELAATIRSGDVAAPPASVRVPRGVRHVLRRGLSVDPEQRYPSMRALLRALRRAVYWPRRVAGALLPASAAAALAVAAWPTAPLATDYCEQFERRLDELWSPTRQDAIEQAFVASGRDYASTSWERVRTRVDDYTARWLGAHRQTCEAEARGEPVDGRMLCLHRRYQQLHRLVELLAEADASMVEHAVEATRGLQAIESCEDDRGPPAPTDPETRRRLEELDALLSRAHVAAEVGRREEARAEAEAAAALADSLGLRWSQAEAHLARAVAADDDGDARPALDAFETAFSAGIAAEHHELTARAAMGLAGLTARTGDFDGADRWLELASAAIDRLDEGEPRPSARLENSRGRVDFHRARFEEALSHFRTSRDIDEAEGRGDDPLLGATMLNIGEALANLGRYDEALEALEDALSREQYHYGETHPRAVRVLNALCHVRSDAGQIEAGIQACEQGIAHTRADGGDDDPKLVHLHTNLGAVLFRAGRHERTEQAYLEALTLARAIYGEGDPMVGNLLNNLGVLYVETGDLGKAQDYYDQALNLFETAFGPEHPAVGILRTNLAMAYTTDDKLDEAEPLLEKSIEVLEATLGPEHVDLALSLAELGRVHAARGDHATAIPLFERAMTLRETAGGEPVELADTKYGLGLSLWERGESKSARARLTEARALYEGAGGLRRERVEEIDAWLEQH